MCLRSVSCCGLSVWVVDLAVPIRNRCVFCSTPQSSRIKDSGESSSRKVTSSVICLEWRDVEDLDVPCCKALCWKFVRLCSFVLADCVSNPVAVAEEN